MSNKCIASSNRCLTSRNKKLLETSALLVVTRFATRNKCIATSLFAALSTKLQKGHNLACHAGVKWNMELTAA